MPLNPKIKVLLDDQKALNLPPLSSLPAAVVQQAVIHTMEMAAAPTAVAAVLNRTIPGPATELPIRVYRPHGTGPFPVLVYIHGGGFVIGNLDTHDEICRRLCVGAGCLVVSLDYRLAPQHKFPAAPDDCLAAVRWVAAHAADIGGDPARIAVGGDSAGGNLTAVTALRIRDQGGPVLRGQLLIYPVVDFHPSNSPSMIENGQDYGLTHDDMHWFTMQYLNDTSSDADNPYASPMAASDLHGLPPALVITAEYDPLLDEGAAYAKRLYDSGVPTVYTCYEGMNHAFMTGVQLIRESQPAMDQACAWLKGVFTAH